MGRLLEQTPLDSGEIQDWSDAGELLRSGDAPEPVDPFGIMLEPEAISAELETSMEFLNGD